MHLLFVRLAKKIILIMLTSVPEPVPDPHVFRPPGSGSGSTSQRYGSAPDLDPSIIMQK